MKTCFGADQVNEDNDADFESCTATPEFGDEDAASPLEKLPGCNPIQSGPAKATPVTGEGCAATAAPNGGNGGSTSATATPTSKAEAVDVSSALPTISAPSVEEGNVGDDSTSKPSPVVASTTTSAPAVSDAATYPASSAAEPTEELPSLSLVSSDSPAETTAPAGGDGECQAPVYVTITPTVYVTAGALDVGNTTACGPTVYETVTNKVTVTVPAPSGYKHGHGHKRHAM
jgi:hypothetical protein